MRQLLLLVLYILFAIGIAWLVYWGSGEIGLPQTLQMILTGAVFVVLLVFALTKTGTLDA